MTDPEHDSDPPEFPGPRCVACGDPIRAGLAGWEHVDPETDADHTAVGRDEE